MVGFLKIEVGAQLKPVFGRFKPRLKFIKFGHWIKDISFSFSSVYITLNNHLIAKLGYTE